MNIIHRRLPNGGELRKEAEKSKVKKKKKKGRTDMLT